MDINSAVGRDVGITDEQLEDLAAFETSPHFDRREKAVLRYAEGMTHKPFIYLSAGVSNPVFIETLELAAESGTKFNGVLCGRATWKDGISIFAKNGEDAFRKWLETTGVENINNVNNALKAASPWYEKFGAKSVNELA